jgi:tetrahydromethanopterin S-methyltransferase subunit B
MAEIYQLPSENSGSNAGMGNIPFSIPIGGFGGGLFGGNGFGNDIGGLIALAIVASIFGWNNGNGFGGFGGGNGQLGFLANQLNNDNGRDLIMQAVTSQGEASRTAIQTLSSMLGQDFNLVNAGVQNVQNSLQTLALQQAVSVPQIINSIQNGDAALASQLCKCCCDNQLAMCQQTNALQREINNVNQSVASKAAADQLAMCQQTYALTDTMNRNYLALDNKIDDLESNRKDREITALTAKIAQLESQNFTTGVVQQAVAPILGQLAGIQNEVDDIKNKMPNTVPVQYPNLQVVNSTPYMGGFYGNGFYGNGFGNGIVF